MRNFTLKELKHFFSTLNNQIYIKNYQVLWFNSPIIAGLESIFKFFGDNSQKIYLIYDEENDLELSLKWVFSYSDYENNPFYELVMELI